MEPSFFVTRTRGDEYGESEGTMIPLVNKSSKITRVSSIRFSGNLYGRERTIWPVVAIL